MQLFFGENTTAGSFDPKALAQFLNHLLVLFYQVFVLLLLKIASLVQSDLQPVRNVRNKTIDRLLYRRQVCLLKRPYFELTPLFEGQAHRITSSIADKRVKFKYELQWIAILFGLNRANSLVFLDKLAFLSLVTSKPARIGLQVNH